MSDPTNHGPQQRPASVRQIEAQRKSLARDLTESDGIPIDAKDWTAAHDHWIRERWGGFTYLVIGRNEDFMLDFEDGSLWLHYEADTRSSPVGRVLLLEMPTRQGVVDAERMFGCIYPSDDGGPCRCELDARSLRKPDLASVVKARLSGVGAISPERYALALQGIADTVGRTVDAEFRSDVTAILRSMPCPFD